VRRRSVLLERKVKVHHRSHHHRDRDDRDREREFASDS
jgi:hypothetical protein